MCGERMVEMVETEYEFLNELKKLKVTELLVTFLSKSILRGKKECKKLFTNQLHYAIFKNLPRFPVTVCVSPNYAVYVYEFKIGSNVGTSFYLFGINSDSRIFVNQLDNVIMDDAEKVFEIVPSFANEIKKPIIVYKISDKLIHNNLGYQVDLENESDKTIPRYFKTIDYSDISRPLSERAYLSYRIQGDVIMAVSDPSDYFAELRRELSDRIRNTMRSVVLQRISNVLGDVGISVNTGLESLWFNALPIHLKRKNYAELIEKLSEFIVDNVNVRDLEAELTLEDPFNVNRESDKIALIVSEGRAGFGERFRPIVIEVSPSRGLADKWADKVLQNVKLDKNWRIIRVGRHLVRYRGYPNRFTITTKLFEDQDGNDEYIIPVRLNRIYISSGEIYIYHPEHGQSEIKVLEDVSAEFVSTHISRIFEDKMNYYALKNLCEFLELKKFYKLA